MNSDQSYINEYPVILSFYADVCVKVKFLAK